MKKRKTRAQRSRSFRCPHCGAAMILRPASEIYHDAKSDRKLYVCHNYPACNTYVAAHPNTDKPMGVPANGNLRNLRIQAHRKFDLTVIVVTTNSDYSGCRDMNQSVISRMDLIYDMEAPDLNTMVKRVMNVTGFADEQEATKMAIVVRDIAERCRQTMITDGSCGMREFKSWVLSTMVTNDPYESALSTIISSASADPDNRAELISACLEPQYSKTI